MQLLHMHGTARAPLTNRRAKFVKELDVDRVNRTGGMLTVVDGGVVREITATCPARWDASTSAAWRC